MRQCLSPAGLPALRVKRTHIITWSRLGAHVARRSRRTRRTVPGPTLRAVSDPSSTLSRKRSAGAHTRMARRRRPRGDRRLAARSSRLTAGDGHGQGHGPWVQGAAPGWIRTAYRAVRDGYRSPSSPRDQRKHARTHTHAGGTRVVLRERQVTRARPHASLPPSLSPSRPSVAQAPVA